MLSHDVCLYLASLSMIIYRSIHVAANGIIPLFFWLNNIPSYLCTTSLSVSGHLGCFHVLAIVNSATMNTGVHVSFQSTVFSGYVPRSGVAGLYSSSVLVF